jgi:hypothetical protein
MKDFKYWDGMERLLAHKKGLEDKLLIYIRNSISVFEAETGLSVVELLLDNRRVGPDTAKIEVVAVNCKVVLYKLPKPL